MNVDTVKKVFRSYKELLVLVGPCYGRYQLLERERERERERVRERERDVKLDQHDIVYTLQGLSVCVSNTRCCVCVYRGMCVWRAAANGELAKAVSLLSEDTLSKADAG